MNLHDKPNVLALIVEERKQHFRCAISKVILTLLLPYSILACMWGIINYILVGECSMVPPHCFLAKGGEVLVRPL